MQLSTSTVIAVLIGTLFSPCATNADDSFADIFNGRDLSGWVASGATTYKDGDEEKPVWTVEDGLIVCAGKGYGFLTFDKELTDFIVHVEYRMCPGCNSGLGIRSKKYDGKRGTRPSTSGYEMQIVDDARRKPSNHSSGSLYRYVAPTVNAHKPAGEWNVVEVECRGPNIKITMNGQVIHDIDQSRIDKIKNKPLSGYFCVQNHGRKIEYRNLRLKEL